MSLINESWSEKDAPFIDNINFISVSYYFHECLAKPNPTCGLTHGQLQPNQIEAIVDSSWVGVSGSKIVLDRVELPSKRVLIRIQPKNEPNFGSSWIQLVLRVKTLNEFGFAWTGSFGFTTLNFT